MGQRSTISLMRYLLCAMVAFAAIAVFQCAPCAASILGAPEEQSWSDMAFPSGVSGNYDAGTQTFSATASVSNDLEIGGQFGPDNSGRNYGPGGTLGGAIPFFCAQLNVTGVKIAPDGTVTNGGSVIISFIGGSPYGGGSFAQDYGYTSVTSNPPLLQGTVTAVQLDARGANTLDILFSITGGALQNINPEIGTNFAPGNIGLLRFTGLSATGGVWSSFSLGSSSSLDVFGIVPEPTYVTLVFFSGILGLGILKKSGYVKCFDSQPN
jgi:hypothetical protein